MTCERIEPLLGAYSDGACRDAEACEVHRHLETCAACRRRLAELDEIRSMLRLEVAGETAPSGLWASVGRALDEEDRTGAARKGATRSVPRLRPLALAASVMLMVAITLSGSWWPTGGAEAVVREPVNDFVTYRLSHRALDIASRDPRANARWFEGKIAFRLPAIETKVAGFELLGSRLCWLLDRRLSALTYQKDGRLLSLYVMSGAGLRLPVATFEPAARGEVSVHHMDALVSVIWRRDGLVYALVSDLPVRELLPFAAAYGADATALRPRPIPVAASRAAMQPQASGARL